MTAIANLPDLRPSLLLDFANSGRVDPRIQCTRASSATCFGPDGKLRTVAAGVPRIDYDPATGKCLGLLVEEARTNLWRNSATAVAQSFAVAAQAYTLSFEGSGSIALTGAYSGDSSAGTLQSGRRTLTFTTSAGSLSCAPSGDVRNVQLEAGAFPTSYIPTEASAVTRAADQVFIEGLAFTGAMSFVQGAVLCSYTSRSTAGNQIVLQARSASANLGFAFQFTASGGARNRALIDDGSGSPPNFSTRPVEAGVKYRAGLSWAPNTASNVVSGGFISTVTQPINISTPQRLGLGHNGFGANYFNGHIHDLSLYAGYIQPAQLQRLTA